jgi:hypothetical protein
MRYGEGVVQTIFTPTATGRAGLTATGSQESIDISRYYRQAVDDIK